jgi:hypothetical protein
MTRVAPACETTQQFLDCGKLLAWRAGLAQYRLTALDAAANLPPTLAAIALDIPSAANVESAIASWRTNPWFDPTAAPDGTLRLVRTIGAFRGFAGQFLRPPLVAFAHNDFHVTDRESTWRLIADRFGSVLLRTDHFPKDATHANARPTIDAAGNIRWFDAAAHVEQLRGVTSAASDGRTLAVTVASSHHVFLLARA